MNRVDVRSDVPVLYGRRARGDRTRSAGQHPRRAGSDGAGRDAGGEVMCQLRVEHRAEDGDTDRTADRAEERGSARRRTQVSVVDRVLHREHEHLNDEAEPDAQHKHERARL